MKNVNERLDGLDELLDGVLDGTVERDIARAAARITREATRLLQLQLTAATQQGCVSKMNEVLCLDD